MTLNIEKFFNTETSQRFFHPSKIFSGIDTLKNFKSLIADFNDDFKLFVISSSIANSEHLKEILKDLENYDILEVSDKPYTQDINNTFEKYKNNIPRVVIAIGGGSVTDYVKGFLIQIIYGDISNINVGQNFPEPQGINKRPLFISFPTTNGSGSEATRYYVTYDKVNQNKKTHGKSFKVIPDFIFQFPLFLKTIPRKLLVTLSFDVFVHFLETLVCRYEISIYGKMFSNFGISQLIITLHRVAQANEIKDDDYKTLLELATMAGVNVTNIRTGSIHEVAGPLLEHTRLTHPETLFVFHKAAIEQYHDFAELRLSNALRLLSAEKELKISSLRQLIDWWYKIFDSLGIIDDIKSEVVKVKDNQDVYNQIFKRVFDDKVWNEKESPVFLDEKKIHEMIKISLEDFS
jgi:alcohol dehydrogenase class IV